MNSIRTLAVFAARSVSSRQLLPASDASSSASPPVTSADVIALNAGSLSLGVALAYGLGQRFGLAGIVGGLLVSRVVWGVVSLVVARRVLGAEAT